jgi:type I restriction enzyme S subunit
MSRKFQVKVIPSKWFEDGGHRLDCGPYLSGAIEARELMIKHRTERLDSLTKGYNGGIFNGPRFARQYVEEREYGVPFLGSTDILDADITHLPLISTRQVADTPQLAIEEDWTLITCSGTIGRTAYSRTDMKGMAGSQHFMRVVPDKDKIEPGFLYSFLSSRFGIPLVISGTYGAIIQHIEPSHLADLPVPRLGAVEEKAHELVQRAADLRVEAAALLRECGETLNQTLGFPDRMSLSYRSFSCTLANASQMVARMEATYYDAVSLKTDEMIATLPNKDLFTSLDISIDETGRLKQIFVDEEYGVPFLTSGEIFQLSYAPTRFLSKRLLPMDKSWAMDEGDILLARSGQVGGIIGRGVWADRRFAGGCVSVDVLRIKTEKARIPAGYLYTYLCLTDVGYHQLIRTAAGSSIPHISASDVYKLWIPRCPDEIEKRIDESVRKAGILRADAQDYEDQARALVEQAIEEGGQ